jgi:hypothetical protein
MFYLILMANNDISSKEIKSKNLFMIKISGYILYIVVHKKKHHEA